MSPPPQNGPLSYAKHARGDFVWSLFSSAAVHTVKG